MANLPKQVFCGGSLSTMFRSSTSVRDMKSLSHAHTPAWPILAWLTVFITGIAAPALAMLLLVGSPAPGQLASVSGPILAVGLMGAGMIASAASGRLWIGILLALLGGAGLILFARALGLPPLPHPLSTGLAFIIASVSFAARGTLFACSASDKGWWIAIFVVAGEAAILVTASAMLGALPDWLLVLLPAQWASVAIQTSLIGTGTLAASWELIALAGTAAATLLVAWLWPSRWPYLLMFTAWLGLSALVWHRPGAPIPRADLAAADAQTAVNSNAEAIIEVLLRCSNPVRSSFHRNMFDRGAVMETKALPCRANGTTLSPHKRSNTPSLAAMPTVTGCTCW